MGVPVYETTFAERVRVELAAAWSGHKPINSLHEGWAIILEEVDELYQQPGDAARKLIQIAAMCQRTAEDLGLI